MERVRGRAGGGGRLSVASFVARRGPLLRAHFLRLRRIEIGIAGRDWTAKKENKSGTALRSYWSMQLSILAVTATAIEVHVSQRDAIAQTANALRSAAVDRVRERSNRGDVVVPVERTTWNGRASPDIRAARGKNVVFCE